MLWWADFAALSGAVLIVGLVVLTVERIRPGRELGVVATATGAIGVILAAAVASLLGIVTAGLVLASFSCCDTSSTPRRLAASQGAASWSSGASPSAAATSARSPDS